MSIITELRTAVQISAELELAVCYGENFSTSSRMFLGE